MSPIIEPDSPREVGECGCGCHRPLVLGDTDCDGYYVGWISECGATFENRAERDRAVGGGRLIDAFNQFNQHGGILGSPPDYEAILEANDVLPQNYGDAMRELETGIELMVDVIPARASRAAMN